MLVSTSVIPAQAGTHFAVAGQGMGGEIGSRLRGNDGFWFEGIARD